MINVTKTFLPPWDEYLSVLRRAWDSGWITNNGELLKELEEKLRKFISRDELYFCTNGTVVLQMALKALHVKGEVITTPFSYVATTNAILWEKCIPVFADISEKDFNVNVDCIESLINSNTAALLFTHVYGNPCDTDAIEAVAKKHNLPVIYDGAHAFGVSYKGKSLLSYGDISTCSFHATKLFHTVEGGLITCNDPDVSRRLMLYRQFGHVYDEYFSVGINAKNSEFHAAMGLAVLPYVDEIISKRKHLCELYFGQLNDLPVSFPKPRIGTESNYGYFPVLFETEKQLVRIQKSLSENEINIRRYFYPSLNLLPHLENTNACPVSENISRRVACLPLYHDLREEDVEKICSIVSQEIHTHADRRS